jgi:hypothetical protein
VYRLLRRTFAQWQPSSSASLSNIIKLLLIVLTPWRAVSFSETQKLNTLLDSLARSSSTARGSGPRAVSMGGTVRAGALGSAMGGLLEAGGELLRQTGGAVGAAGISSGGSAVGAAGPSGAGVLFGGAAGHVAASASATLNRWGSELQHMVAATGHGGGGAGGGEAHGEQRGVTVRQLLLRRPPALDGVGAPEWVWP